MYCIYICCIYILYIYCIYIYTIIYIYIDIILYYITLYILYQIFTYIIIYFVISYNVMLYHTMLCYIILCYIILYYIILHYIILCFISLCYIILYIMLWHIKLNIVLLNYIYILHISFIYIYTNQKMWSKQGDNSHQDQTDLGLGGVFWDKLNCTLLCIKARVGMTATTRLCLRIVHAQAGQGWIFDSILDREKGSKPWVGYGWVSFKNRGGNHRSQNLRFLEEALALQ